MRAEVAPRTPEIPEFHREDVSPENLEAQDVRSCRDVNDESGN